MLTTLGATESAAWLRARGLDATRATRWYAEIAIAVADDIEPVRFELNLYPEEWGYVFRTSQRVSSIRITDEPFVHGSDDHRVLAHTPPLERLGELLHRLEATHGIAFQRTSARVRSNLPRAAPVIRAWLQSL